jgi:predicted RNA-binding protein with RPS1 domain
MSDMVNWMQLLPEPDRLARSTRHALFCAKLVATHMRAEEIQPEHLLLGLIKQNDARIVRMSDALGLNLNTIRDCLILSVHLPAQEWRQRLREELLDELKPGEIRRGVVSNITDFGIFVDLGGAEGLVQTSQLAWSSVNHPSELFKVGQGVVVQILSVDKEKKKIALSIKQAQVDPWATVERRYTPGQVVTGIITKIAPFGVFASIDDGVEGLIRLSKLTPGMDPKTSLHEGQHLQLRILEIDTKRRRLSLSLRQVGEIDVDEVPSMETGEKNHVDDGQLFSYEETLKARESTTSRDVGEGKAGLPFSQESLECLDWAISFAKHVHSTVAYPDHLLLSILLQKRIQSILLTILPSPEALLSYFTGGITPGDAKSASFQSGVCPSCKQPILPGWKHCVYCGASLARICPKCGAPYPEIEGAQFCFECGGPLEE